MRIKFVLDAIPPRSPWYPLEAIGVGSPVVENLTSDVTGMARQHRYEYPPLPVLVGQVLRRWPTFRG